MESFEEFLLNPTNNQEKSHSSPYQNEYHDPNYVRGTIRSQVDDVLWMNDVNSRLDAISVASAASQSFGDDLSETQRCAVCTLPIGTCSHSTPWLENSLHSSLLSSVETELDQVFGVLDSSLVVETKPDWPDIDLTNIKWADHSPRIVDKIGDSLLPLSLPPERGWHSLEQVGKYLVLFGGLKFKDRMKFPEPYGSVVRPDDVEYLADCYLYDIENLSWHIVIPKDSDSQNRTSWPCGRYGHATASLDRNHMILFGGRTHGGRYLSDTWILSLITFCWTPASVISQSNEIDNIRPSPRAFTALAQSPSTRSIVLYGGTNGIEIYNDLWVFKWGGKAFEFDNQSDEIKPSVCGVHDSPDPMEGGSLNPLSTEMFWTREVAVGGSAPPAARYGHKLLTLMAHPDCYGGGRKTKLQNGTFLAVVGGCCVSPSKELEGRESSSGASGALPPTEIKKLLQLCKNLQERYASEGNFSVVAGKEILSRLEEIELKCGIQSKLSQSVSDLRQIVKRSAIITARLADMEKQTRMLESDLTEAWFAAQALSLAITNSATHTYPTIGVHFLCVDDMAWVPQIHPKMAGTIPCSRMYHGAVTLGDHIFVFGGVKPTALSHQIVDEDTTQIYALDLKTLIWSRINTIDSTAYLDGPLRVAEVDIQRAEKQIEIEKSRGIAAGARAGITVELMEAEAVLTVCKWRKSMLLEEQIQLRPPPMSAWGFASTIIPAAGNPRYLGSRALFHGGWNHFGSTNGVNLRLEDNMISSESLERKLNMTDCLIVLDCELELERRRRLEEEFHARLERERQEKVSKAIQNEIQSLFELRMAMKEEKERQERELSKMRFEDYLSSLPPLSKPSPVQLVKANEHTFWVRWKRSRTNTVGKILAEGSVTYFLYISGGFVAFNPGDRVRVLPPPQENGVETGNDVILKNQAKPDGDNSSEDSESDDDTSVTSKSHSNEKAEFGKPRKIMYIAKTVEKLPYNGEIIGTQRGTGLFTIRADDGSIEKNVPRSRLRSLLLIDEEEMRGNSANSQYLQKRKSPQKLSKRQLSYQKARSFLKDVLRNDSRNPQQQDRLGKEWKLVYMGDKLEYAIEGLVPWDVLQQEPGITVDVSLCLRTTGVDYPEGEFSDISDPVTYSTIWPNILKERDENDEISVLSSNSLPVSEVYHPKEKMSKMKKEVITAVLSGQQSIQLERRNDVIIGEGLFDSFL